MLENSNAVSALHAGDCKQQQLDTFPVGAAHVFTDACLKCAAPTYNLGQGH